MRSCSTHPILVVSIIAMTFGLLELPACHRTGTPVTPVIEHASPANGTRVVDIDGNGIPDLTFDYTNIVASGIPTSEGSCNLRVRASSGNGILASISIGPLPLTDSVPIGQSSQWVTYYMDMAWLHWTASDGWDASWAGPWIGVQRRNLGVRVLSGSSYHYAWLKCSIDSHTGLLTVSDSAFQLQPDIGIMAGIHP
jgi:hypothetical protein